MKIYLDQNILSLLAKGTDLPLTDSFEKIINSRDSKIVLSLAHILETAKASQNIRDSIAKFVSSIKYIYIRPTVKIMDDQIKALFKSFINNTKPVELNPFGYIFEESDKYVPFSALVDKVVKGHLTATKLVNLNIEQRFQRILKKKTLDEKAKEEEINNETKALVNSFINIPNIWELPSSIVLPRNFIIKQQKEFVNNFNPDWCPILKIYCRFQTLKYRNRNIREFNDAIYDVEHAVLGSYYCNFLICEKNMREILRQVNDQTLVRAKIFNSIPDFLNNISYPDLLKKVFA